MRTTLEIPDATFRRAKTTASAIGIPSANTSQRLSKKNLRAEGIVPTNPGLNAGELAHLHSERLRIQKIIDEEFEQIEPCDQRLRL